MLWTLTVILLVLWLLGLVSGAAMGGFIHVLLVLAIIVVLFRLIQGRRLTTPWRVVSDAKRSDS